MHQCQKKKRNKQTTNLKLEKKAQQNAKMNAPKTNKITSIKHTKNKKPKQNQKNPGNKQIKTERLLCTEELRPHKHFTFFIMHTFVNSVNLHFNL